jgi:beta-lactamase class A
MRRLIIVLLGWAFFAGLALPATAQAPSPELRSRAEQLVALLRGAAQPADLFSPAFLAQIPEAQVRAVARELVAQYGEVRGLERVEPQSATAGVLHFDFARALVHMNLVIDPQPPHRISGLLVTGADMRGDTLAAVAQEIDALPGSTSFAVARLGDGPPELLASVEPDRPLAIGSAFKLFILAELSRQVQAGGRRWNDVVALDRRSLPSGTLQAWPAGSPLTLHSLAALMISQSDNTATDTLLHLAGREQVERMMATIGVAAAARNRPLLSTLELAALKTGPETAVQAWRDADEAGRRALLARDYGAIEPARIDLARFTGAPLHVDLLEWFASADDLVRTMDWLRRHGDDTARAILAINPGLPPAVTGELAYVGYKGGSEPGVVSLSWLVRNRAGAWHVVTASWNNPAAPVEEGSFVRLLARAVQLVR